MKKQQIIFCAIMSLWAIGILGFYCAYQAGKSKLEIDVYKSNVRETRKMISNAKTEPEHQDLRNRYQMYELDAANYEDYISRQITCGFIVGVISLTGSGLLLWKTLKKKTSSKEVVG